MLPELKRRSTKSARVAGFEESGEGGGRVRVRKTRSGVVTAGINGVPLDEPSCDGATAPGLGDGTRAVLNAAALQKLSMVEATGQGQKLRVYNGRLLRGLDPAILDGVSSADVSYIADAAGEYGSMRGRGRSGRGRGGARARVPALFDRASDRGAERGGKDGEVGEGGEGGEGGRTELVPPSRADAVATADALRRGLDGLGARASVDEELALWDTAFAQAAAQVFVQCAERGRLLEAIRRRYAEVCTSLVSAARATPAGASASALAALLAPASAPCSSTSSSTSRTALRLTRAGYASQREAHAAAAARVASEARAAAEASSREASARVEAEAASARASVLAAQLREARARLTALEASGGHSLARLDYGLTKHCHCGQRRCRGCGWVKRKRSG